MLVSGGRRIEHTVIDFLVDPRWAIVNQGIGGIPTWKRAATAICMTRGRLCACEWRVERMEVTMIDFLMNPASPAIVNQGRGNFSFATAISTTSRRADPLRFRMIHRLGALSRMPSACTRSIDTELQRKYRVMEFRKRLRNLKHKHFRVNTELLPAIFTLATSQTQDL